LNRKYLSFGLLMIDEQNIYRYHLIASQAMLNGTVADIDLVLD